MKFSSFCNGFYKILLKVILLLWGIITFTTIFHIYNNDTYKLNSLVILVGCLITLLVLIFLYRYLSRFKESVHNRIAFALFIGIFIIMLGWGFNYQVIPSYDLSHIIAKVNDMIGNKTMIFGSSAYFSIYPTQIPLTLLIYGIESLGQFIGMSNPANLMIIYNAFMTSLSLYFVYKVIRKLFNSRVALIGMIILALYPDFYLFVSYYYTDIISLPFSIIGYYFLIKFDYSKLKGRYGYLILAGILFAIGARLRVVVLILLIAYVLVYISKRPFKDIFKMLGIIMFVFLFSIMIYSKALVPSFSVSLDDSIKLPALHWVMMGLNVDTDGGYTDKDAIYSALSSNKNNDIIEQIKSRITTVNLKFYYQKLSRVWSTGDHDILRKYDMISRYDSMHKFLYGKPQIFIRYWSQFLKVIIYLLFFITLCLELNRRVSLQNSKNATVIIAVFGAILFYLLWEALNRYSFSFLPWILIAGISSIGLIDNFLKMNNIRIEKNKIDLMKHRRSLGIFIIILTNLLLIFAGVKYVYLDTNQEDYRIVQDNNTKHFISVIDEEVKEVFEVNDSFNKIQLQMKNDTIDKTCEYIYEIYDMGDNLLYQGIKKITKGVYSKNDNPLSIANLNLNLPTINVNGKKKFYLKFYSKEASEDNYISINTFVLERDLIDYEYNSPEFLGETYDVNPHGETYINDLLLDGSLRIKVSLVYNGPILKVYQFIILVFFVELTMFVGVKNILLTYRHKKRS